MEVFEDKARIDSTRSKKLGRSKLSTIELKLDLVLYDLGSDYK